MRHSLPAWAIALFAVSATAQPPDPPLIEHSTDRLCQTAGGRPVTIQRLRHPESPRGGPALLIVAGIDPRCARSADIAAGLADRLSQSHGPALRRCDVYIITRLNPDGLDAAAQAKRETARNPAPGESARIDADRDGRFDEDPPVDLDGDGRILQMRVKHPAPGSGLTAEWVEEDGEPRLLRRADRNKGERPVFAMLTESRDADGDGQFGEDGTDGIELDRNFPYHWPEFRDEAGRVPLSEIETRALAEWLLAHPNVVAIVTYAAADNLVNVPPGEKKDPTGEAPATNHILDGDRPMFEDLSAKFKEITRQKEAPTRDNDGTLQGWAYAQLGLWSFTNPAWVHPDQLREEDKKDEKKTDKAEAKPDDKLAEPPAEKPKPRRIDTSDGRWLALSDARVDKGEAAGFVAWKPFEHPQLGTVEIGGFVLGYRFDIPAADLPRIIEEQGRFLAEIMDRLPRLTMQPPRVESLGENVWRVSIDIVNEGKWPTRSEMGVKVRRLAQTRVSIDVDRARILSGDRTARADTIAGGASIRASWTIAGKAGDAVKITLNSPECGDQELSVSLETTPAPKERQP